MLVDNMWCKDTKNFQMNVRIIEKSAKKFLLAAFCPLCGLVKQLSYSVDMVANRSAHVLAIVQQVHRIEQSQVFDFAHQVKQLAIVNARPDDSQVYIRPLTVVPFRPGAENQNSFDVGMPPEHPLQFLNDRVAQTKPHSC